MQKLSTTRGDRLPVVGSTAQLKGHAAEIAKDITETGESMLITQNGEVRLIVMDVSSYEQRE